MSWQRWKLTVEYHGQDYKGWQRQKHAYTVQQAVEEAIYKFCQQEIRIQAAGRTDSGVHARGQVFHFDIDYGDRRMDEEKICKAINAHLRPQPISISHAEKVDSEFHARFHATNKLYRYIIVNRPSPPIIERGLVWHINRPLDVDAMREGAKHLLGHHDFTTFRDSQCQAKSPIKDLERFDISVKDYDNFGGLEIWLETEGQSFLHHQVRNMVGVLYLVGIGQWKPDDVKTALEAKDRSKGGPTCPPDGLYLMRIDY